MTSPELARVAALLEEASAILRGAAADPGDTLLRLRPAVPLDGPGEPETSGPGMMRIQPQEPWPELPAVDIMDLHRAMGPMLPVTTLPVTTKTADGMRWDPGRCDCGAAGFAFAASSPPGVTFPSVINSVYRVELATKAKRTATAKLTRIAERSRDTLKREAARVELLARMAPAPLPVMRDDWDNLPDVEPDGIVRRP